MAAQANGVDISYSTGFGDLVGLPRALSSLDDEDLPLPEVREISLAEWLTNRLLLESATLKTTKPD